MYSMMLIIFRHLQRTVAICVRHCIYHSNLSNHISFDPHSQQEIIVYFTQVHAANRRFTWHICMCMLFLSNAIVT